MRLFIVAGEYSGDHLGGKLLEALKAAGAQMEVSGLGDEKMEEQGVASIFPLSEVAVMGPVDILKNLPRIVKRVYQTVDAALAFEPDLVVIIDAPEFTHPIAKRIRKKMPDVPIINYVSPSVWAWRPGRARRMKRYITHVMGLLPFEPQAYLELDGPPCTYVGHSLVEKKSWVEGLDLAKFYDTHQLSQDRPLLVVLPGSRRSEISKLMPVFGETVSRLRFEHPGLQIVLPVVESRRSLVEDELEEWDVKPIMVSGEENKFAAFRAARAAIAASGTVTLELALAGCPMVVGYKVDQIAIRLRFLVKVRSIILANLVLDENAFPEFIQDECEAENLFPALNDLLQDTPDYEKQKTALATIADRLMLEDMTPSEKAAKVVLEVAKQAGVKS